MFRTRLKQLRERLNHSQKSLAEIIGVTGQQIYRWESGENSPSAETVADIARKLGVTTDFLLGLTDEPQGYISAGNEVVYSDTERLLIAAFRSGDLAHVFEAGTALAKQKQKTGVIDEEPAVNS